MDKKDKEPRGTAATASKMAANNGPSGGESPSPNQGATGSQQQNQGTQNQGDQQDLLQQAKQTTNEVVSQVQQQANSQITQQKDSAANELSTVVNAVRRFGESLNNEGTGPIARFAAQYGDKAANSLDSVARYLREQDPKRLFNDVQNFGRRQPALMIGGAFLLGFAGARIIKSSMDAASSSSTYHRPQGLANTPNTRVSPNPGTQQPAFNTNTPGAQQPSPPPNPA
jgi:cell division septation protein DedD